MHVYRSDIHNDRNVKKPAHYMYTFTFNDDQHGHSFDARGLVEKTEVS